MAIWDSKKFARINWKNRPSTATALGATNLNKIDVFCNEVDNALIQFDAQKLNIATVNSMIASLTINEDTGLITAKQLDGTTYTWDLNIEKIPVSFTLSEEGVLTMTTEDGTQWTCNIAELIKDYVFDDSSTISFTKQFNGTDDDGKGSYHVSASLKVGSVNEQHLDPDYRADILAYKTQAQQAANDALTYSKDSKRWAVGDSSYEGSDVDNSKYYKEQAEAAKTAAEQARDEAQAATGNVIMAPGTLGVGKPDGTTVDTSADGTISAKTVEAGDDIEESGSSLKTAWLNLKDGLLKRFAWSHVKAIFYDYAESKLLSAKLDEMDQVSGDLSGLTTTAKGSLVSAVNEVDGNIGDLSGLTTTAKTNLVAAVDELNQNMGGMVILSVDALENTVTFTLKRSGDGYTRYTAFLCLADQNTSAVGSYIIGINQGKETITKISGTNASISRSGDDVTITFETTSIWSKGILIAPSNLM